jgi:osmotically-inducible protein OsmY
MKTAEDLRFDVQAELEWEPSLEATGIGVAVHEGAVTLAGHVKTYAEKLAAEKAAKRVQGVIAVANELEVHASYSKRDDSDVADEVARALRSSVSVPAAVQGVVTNAWVKLTGEVDWDYQRRAAFNAVRMLPGVRGVSNLITLKPRATSAEVKQKIESAFKRSAQIDADNVSVMVKGSTAFLNGWVHSWSERSEAEHAAWSAPGITSVENRLVVRPAAMVLA